MHNLLIKLAMFIASTISHISNFSHFLLCWVASQQEPADGHIHRDAGLYRIGGTEEKGSLCGAIDLSKVEKVQLVIEQHPFYSVSWITEEPPRLPWTIYIASKENSTYYKNPYCTGQRQYRSADFIGRREIEDLVHGGNAKIIIADTKANPEYSLWITRGSDAAWRTHLLQEEWEQHVAKHAAKLLVKAERKLDRARRVADKIEATSEEKQQRANRKLRSLLGEVSKLRQYA